MPLRTPNDPNTPLVLLAAVRQFLLPNTYLASLTPDAGLSRVYIRDLFSLSVGQFPAVNLHTGARELRPISGSTNAGAVLVVADYYDTWTEDTARLVAIKQRVMDDIERMVANLESAPDLGGYARSYSAISISPDNLARTDEVPGLDLVKGYFAFQYNILPYDI